MNCKHEFAYPVYKPCGGQFIGMECATCDERFPEDMYVGISYKFLASNWELTIGEVLNMCIDKNMIKKEELNVDE